MKTLVERLREINTEAKLNFDKAQGMLDMLNDIMGTQFGWLAKRVVVFENPNGSVAERYAAVHDAVMMFDK